MFEKIITNYLQLLRGKYIVVSFKSAVSFIHIFQNFDVIIQRDSLAFYCKTMRRKRFKFDYENITSLQISKEDKTMSFDVEVDGYKTEIKFHIV